MNGMKRRGSSSLYINSPPWDQLSYIHQAQGVPRLDTFDFLLRRGAEEHKAIHHHPGLQWPNKSLHGKTYPWYQRERPIILTLEKRAK